MRLLFLLIGCLAASPALAQVHRFVETVEANGCIFHPNYTILMAPEEAFQLSEAATRQGLARRFDHDGEGDGLILTTPLCSALIAADATVLAGTLRQGGCWISFERIDALPPDARDGFPRRDGLIAYLEGKGTLRYDYDRRRYVFTTPECNEPSTLPDAHRAAVARFFEGQGCNVPLDAGHEVEAALFAETGLEEDLLEVVFEEMIRDGTLDLRSGGRVLTLTGTQACP